MVSFTLRPLYYRGNIKQRLFDMRQSELNAQCNSTEENKNTYTCRESNRDHSARANLLTELIRIIIIIIVAVFVNVTMYFNYNISYFYLL